MVTSFPSLSFFLLSVKQVRGEGVANDTREKLGLLKKILFFAVHALLVNAGSLMRI
jgi:hypothetical protein